MHNFETETFFRDKAFAYSQGRLRYLSSLFVTPTTFSMGTQKLVLETPLDVEQLFQTYRENLMEQGYEKTVADVLHSDPTAENGFRCLVTYRNLSGAGDVISTEHGSYFLDRTADGYLRISFVEFLDEPRADLMAGFDRL